MSRPRIRHAIVVGCWAALTGCTPLAHRAPDPGRSSPDLGTTAPGSAGDAGTPPITPNPGACVNLQCEQVACTNGGSTTVSGTVYDPAGVTPLYNVLVYVPNATPDPITPGITAGTCQQCGADATGSPLTTALTDASGKFTLTNVPVGGSIPLVIQIGKWRRQVTIPVKACQDNPITDINLTRLPRTQSEGDMPQMALVTGGCDALECLLLKMGIDASEFTNGTGSGRVHIYSGSGGETIDNSTAAQPFWSSVDNLLAHDVTLLSCECGTASSTKPAAALNAMHDYTSMGGRVFGTHYHYYWLTNGPSDFQATASWTPDGDSGDTDTSGLYTVDQTLPKGMAFAQWLVNVGASTTLGQLPLDPDDVMGDLTTVNSATTQQWIYSPNPDFSVKYMSFNTPIGAPVAQQCGRFVFSDLHVTDDGIDTFPTDCDMGALTPQEQALEFLFFDLNSCIQDPTQPPPSPNPVT